MEKDYELIFREWLDSVKDFKDKEKLFRYIFQDILDHENLGAASNFTNNIPPSISFDLKEDELSICRKTVNAISWNATIAVLRANAINPSIGGHISTYLSASFLHEVGLNHFFKGNDLVFFQGHSSPGVYARAMLEGRIDEAQLNKFRLETLGGLPSYPHPRSMPNFWQFPSVSMGLSPLTAIYHARFMKYLQSKRFIGVGQTVYSFVGDGEMDEPESLAGLRLAAQERLNNLVFIVNCNNIRLDLPISESNNSIIEMERIFKGYGWNVVKLIWNSAWSKLFERYDLRYRLLELFNRLNDSEYLSLIDNQVNLQDLVDIDNFKHLLSEMDIRYPHGGMCYESVYRAYKYTKQLLADHEKPVVILARTVKGYGIPSVEGKTISHQKKSLTTDQLKSLRKFLSINVKESDLASLSALPFYKNQEITKYLRETRATLGGYLPNNRSEELKSEDKTSFVDALDIFSLHETKREISSTVALVRILAKLKRNRSISSRILTIVPDEGYTFGMESLFNRYGIYSNASGIGNRFSSKRNLLDFGRSSSGEFFNDGINEAGALANMISIGGSTAIYGIKFVPFYFFYSMFGFQRTADLFWAMADQMSSGFAIATLSGGTSFPGEGLQHVDFNSQLIADTNPSCYAYDPAFMYELGCIVNYGLKKMYQDNEKIFFHINTYNEPSFHQQIGDKVDIDKLCRGMYMLNGIYGGDRQSATVNILASGSAVYRAVEAQKILKTEHAISSKLWSVTSWSLLYRDCKRNDGNSLLVEFLRENPHPVVGISDFASTIFDRLRCWIPQKSVSMGINYTFGASDTRENLRRSLGLRTEDIVANSLELVSSS